MLDNLVSIYRSPKKEEMYIYVQKHKGLKEVPERLLNQFGKPKHVMDLLLKPGKTLARVDVEKVLEDVKEKGFFLQMPPETENFLEQHLEQQINNGTEDTAKR